MTCKCGHDKEEHLSDWCWHRDQAPGEATADICECTEYEDVERIEFRQRIAENMVRYGIPRGMWPEVAEICDELFDRSKGES